MRILLVEDEEKVARFIQRGLEAEGYAVSVAYDGVQGEESALKEPFDLFLLDILLPRKNGFDVLTSIRKAGIAAPVLMLTSRSGTGDIVKG
ncbi:MAG: response regulator, partial [Bacteroidota bacterium]